MLSPHILNLVIHIAAGIVAMGFGFFILATEKGTFLHRKRGRWFSYFVLIVCASAVVGSVFFRFIPLFAILTVLVLYQLLSGWHVIYTKASGPNAIDALMTLCAALWTALLLSQVLNAGVHRNTSTSVVYASLGGLAILIAYDTIRWSFPAAWYASLWRYEHIYKMIASLFAMVAAFSGNAIRFGQPYSQILPSVLGNAIIIWFLRQNYRKQKGVALNPNSKVKNSRFGGYFMKP